jgi:predicted nucleic acid-binding protein
VPNSFAQVAMRVNDLPERIVIDASLGLKWVLTEEQSDHATAVGSGRELLTSALFWAEAGNAIATRVRRGELDRVRGNDALRDLQVAPLRTRPLDSGAVLAALSIAHDLAHPIYDCCYLALALEEDAVVVTADRRFRSAVAAHPALANRVVLLRDIAVR